MRTLPVFIFSTLLSVTVSAQKLAASDIYLFDMEQMNDSVYSFSNPKFLTSFNKGGYNNQPNFFTDDEIFLTVQMVTDTTQTDIYKLNLKEESIAQVTATPESEYSPTIVIEPYDHLKNFYFSCIRVEEEDTMRIWQFPLDRSENGFPVIKSVNNTGYHEWLNEDYVAVFLVGNPHNLTLVNRNTEDTEFITSNIGRCFKKISEYKIAYIHKIGNTFWQLKEMDINTRRTERIVTVPGESEDFVYLSDGTYLMGNGNKLYKFNKDKDKAWVEIADFSYYGFEKITRIAVNNANQIVFVVQ